VYARLGQTERALEEVASSREHAADLPPLESLRVLGTYHLLRHELAEARREFQTLVSLYPEDWRAHFELGETEYRRHDLPGAIAAFRKAVSLDPTRVESLLGLGMASLTAGDTMSARQAWDRASLLEPANGEVVSMGGLIELIETNISAALKIFRQAAASPIHRISSHANFLIAQAQVLGGRYQAAIQTLDAGIEQDRREGDTDSEAGKRIARAQIYLLLADPSRALAECRLVPARDQDPARLGALGSVYARAGEVEQARETLQRIERKPPLPITQLCAAILHGEIELASGQPEKAIQAFTHAKRLQAGDLPLEPLARALAQAGRLQEAAREYRGVSDAKAEMLFPTQITWFMGTWTQALLETARCLAKLEQPAEAKQFYRNYLWVLDGAEADSPSLQEAKSFLKKR